MLEELQLAVCALRQNRSAERLHDLLDGHGLAGELILGRAARTLVCNSMLVARMGKHTRRDQRLPCPQAAGQCIFATSVPPAITMWGIAAVPARNLKRRAENLGAHKFSHCGGWLGRLCDGRKWECLCGRSGGGAVGRVAGQQVCAVGDLDRAASRIGSVREPLREARTATRLKGPRNCWVWRRETLEIVCSACSVVLLGRGG
jgi:hypothetical protein